MTNKKKTTNIVITKTTSQEETLELVNHIMRHRDSDLEGVSITYIGQEGEGPPDFVFFDPDVSVVYVLHPDTGYMLSMSPCSGERVADVMNSNTFASERRKVRNWTVESLYKGRASTDVFVRPSSDVILT